MKFFLVDFLARQVLKLEMLKNTMWFLTNLLWFLENQPIKAKLQFVKKGNVAIFR